MYKETEKDKILNLLGNSRLFSEWNGSDLQRIIEKAQVVTFKKDDTIFEPTKIGSRLYLILDGSVLILSPEDKSTIAEFVSGEMFGEMALLTRSPQNAYAQAVNDVQILEFPRNGENLTDALAEYPEIVARLLQSFLIFVANRTRRANALVKENSPIVQQLRKQMYGDKLTGLLNRIYLEENLDQFLADKPSLIMMKPDNFKQINDQFGHETGDAVLTLMAKDLSENVAETSQLIRYAGNEFTILTPNHSREQALDLAQLIQKELHELDISSVTKTTDISLSMSLGIAVAPEHGSTAEALIKACVELPLVGRARGGKQILFPEEAL